MSDKIEAELRGAFFKRAGTAILKVTPKGARLVLVREPDNKYDGNAIRVGIDPSAHIAWLEGLDKSMSPPEGEEQSLVSSLEFALAGSGLGIEDLTEVPFWDLGMVGKEWASAVAPRMDAGEVATAELSFDGAGKPLCVIEIGEVTAE